MNIHGPGLAEQARQRDRFAATVTAELSAMLADVAGRQPNVEGLTVIHTLWTTAVDKSLLPKLGAVYWHAVHAVAGQLAAGRKAQTAGADCGCDQLTADAQPSPYADPLAAETAIIPVGLSSAEQYLQAARNRLVGIGDDVWAVVREQLLAGMFAGEGVTQLAARIRDESAGIATPRAEVIARTEVNGASNTGAMDQIRAVKATGTKTWLATGDARTRPEHAAASGQTVGMGETFAVGGEQLDRPLDPNGSPGNTINCRCTATFEVDGYEQELGDEELG